MTKKIIASLLASLTVMTGIAHASSWLVCNGSKKIKWDSNSTSARINTGSFPAGPTLQSAQRGINITNANPSKFTINHTTESGGVGRGNGQNEIYASDISPPGVARMRYHCYWAFGTRAGLDEVDIVLDSGRSWTNSRNKNHHNVYGGSGRPIEPVIVHEAGHYLGLMHVNSEYNIMGDSWKHHHTNGSTTKSYFGEDASRGAIKMYGAQSSRFEDLSASHWRYTGSSGEYSSHGRTRMFASNGTTVLTERDVEGEPGYIVNRGDNLRAEFTIENNGKNTQANVRYGIYISTNDFISRFDRRVRTGGWSSIHPENVATQQFSFRVPNDLVRGRKYWVGIRVDDTNVVSETTGTNNV
ncbi:MAG: CARDB domain-containing protein, partial [Parvularculaceae bacterium]